MSYLLVNSEALPIFVTIRPHAAPTHPIWSTATTTKTGSFCDSVPKRSM